jgi:RNA polymerase sigma factor (sigma-70 family)
MAQIPQTRASLLVRLRDRQDDAAWRQFVDLYAPLVYGYARKQGLQDADAGDLCQEVLGTVAGSVARLEYDSGRGAFRNWLFTIVRRKLSNWRRAQKSRPQASPNSDDRQLLEQQPAPLEQADWDDRWEEQLFAWACEQVRREVAETTWQAFWRTAIDDEPGKKVAADLGLNVAAVYQARSRVLARLKEQIELAQQT